MYIKRAIIAVACAAIVTTTAGTSASSARSVGSAVPVPSAPTSYKRLVFSDEFDGSSKAWATCYPWWSPTSGGCTNEGNVDELQWFVPSAVTRAPEGLRLTASRRPTLGTFRGSPKIYSYRSGMLQSRDIFSFQYGYAEFRMKLAPGNAMWDAAWMLPVRWDHRGEIDVFEGYGQAPRGLALTYHAPSGGRSRRELRGLPDLTAGFHTYGIDWQPTKLTWYLDGVPVYTVNAPTPAEPMYLLVTLAVGGRFVTPTTPSPATSSAVIDYVRVWQR